MLSVFYFILSILWYCGGLKISRGLKQHVCPNIVIGRRLMPQLGCSGGFDDADVCCPPLAHVMLQRPLSPFVSGNTATV